MKDLKVFLKHIILFLVVSPAMRLFEFFERMFGIVVMEKIKNRGCNCIFEGYGRIYESNMVKIDDHVFVGRNFFIRAAGGVEIGSYTHISRNVTIHTVNHNIEGELLPYDKVEVKKAVKIGRYVWIGMNVCILPGVNIGDGAVIGMGAVISKDVQAGDVVVGSGQRIVSKRNESHTQDLLNNNKFLLIKGS